MTEKYKIGGGYFRAPSAFWSKAYLSHDSQTRSVLQLSKDSTNKNCLIVNKGGGGGGGGSLFYLIPVGNFEHPDLRINSCRHIAIATKDENGTILYLKFRPDPAATGRGHVKVTSAPLDRFCVFLKVQNLLDHKIATSITFIDDRNIVMHLHYQEAQNVLLFKKKCIGTSEKEMFWNPEFKVIGGVPPKEKSLARVVAEEVVKEISFEIGLELGWLLFSILLM